jgi:hypothetical protein
LSTLFALLWYRRHLFYLSSAVAICSTSFRASFDPEQSAYPSGQFGLILSFVQ